MRITIITREKDKMECIHLVLASNRSLCVRSAEEGLTWSRWERRRSFTADWFSVTCAKSWPNPRGGVMSPCLQPVVQCSVAPPPTPTIRPTESPCLEPLLLHLPTGGAGGAPRIVAEGRQRDRGHYRSPPSGVDHIFCTAVTLEAVCVGDLVQVPRAQSSRDTNDWL